MQPLLLWERELIEEFHRLTEEEQQVILKITTLLADKNKKISAFPLLELTVA